MWAVTCELERLLSRGTLSVCAEATLAPPAPTAFLPSNYPKLRLVEGTAASEMTPTFWMALLV